MNTKPLLSPTRERNRKVLWAMQRLGLRLDRRDWVELQEVSGIEVREYDKRWPLSQNRGFDTKTGKITNPVEAMAWVAKMQERREQLEAKLLVCRRKLRKYKRRAKEKNVSLEEYVLFRYSQLPEPRRLY